MFRYDRLDELVAETGKKKRYLSKKIGHSERYLNDAKKQNTNIKTEEVKILADELNTTVAYLQGLTNEKKPILPKEDGLTETQHEAWTIIQDMDDDTLRQFIRVARAMMGD